jgi:hypothetical protein
MIMVVPIARAVTNPPDTVAMDEFALDQFKATPVIWLPY